MQTIELLKSYFNKLDEESIRNNFVLIYELLDGAHISSRNHVSRCSLQHHLVVLQYAAKFQTWKNYNFVESHASEYISVRV
jgi:hypothetical protein